MMIQFYLAIVSQVVFSHAQDRLIQTESSLSWMNADQIKAESIASHKDGRCGGFFDVTNHWQYYQSLKGLGSSAPLHVVLGSDPTQQDVVAPLLPQISSRRMHQTVADLSSFKNRFSSSEEGARAVRWLGTRFKQILEENNRGANIEYFAHDFVQPSLIVRIPGSDLANEVVVIGGHVDSISWAESAPGADDNASGIATVLEIFQVLVENQFRPRRTIEFMAYAGEEQGLLGSQDIAKHYRLLGKEVVAVMQFDMTFFPGSGRQISIIGDNVDSHLTDFVTKLIDTYVQIPWARTECGYACSDHASWHRSGYPAAFPFEAQKEKMNSKIHTIQDTLAQLSAEHGVHFAKLGMGFAIELSTN